VLASVLHDTRFAETKGTGIEVMRENLKEAGLAPPEFKSDRSADYFVTTFYLHHFLASEDLDWLGQFKHLNLSEAQVRGLIHAREAGRIDNETYRDINGVETLAASQDLRQLRDAGLLDQQEQSRATYYKPTDTLLGTEPTDQGTIPFESEDADTQAEEEPTKPKAETPQAEEETLDAEEETLDAEEETLDASELPPNLPEELVSLIHRIHGQRLSQQELRNAIRRLCRWKPLSMRELASFLGKRREYLSTHVTPMVKRGTLERTRPDAPRSPNQRYRTSSDASLPDE